METLDLFSYMETGPEVYNIGTHSVGFIVANLSPSQNSWTNYVNVSENVHLRSLMKL